MPRAHYRLKANIILTRKPLSASASTKDVVTLLGANVEVRATAPSRRAPLASRRPTQHWSILLVVVDVRWKALRHHQGAHGRGGGRANGLSWGLTPEYKSEKTTHLEPARPPSRIRSRPSFGCCAARSGYERPGPRQTTFLAIN
jgi:hypothetical protein